MTPAKALSTFGFGGCHSFAVGLLRCARSGSLRVLQLHGMPVHVFLDLGGKRYDVNGLQTLRSMARNLLLNLDGLYVDSKPSSVSPVPGIKPPTERLVSEAVRYIESHPALFNMNRTPSSTFISRAHSLVAYNLVAYTPSVAGDLDRIDRLPLVESVRVYSKKGNEVVYRATMPVGVKMNQVRELTGHIQNLFGARLLSSGPTQEKDDSGVKRDIVEVRTSLLVLV